MSELVLLLRSGGARDPFERAFRKEGFDVRSIPVLEFDFVNPDGLREALEHPNNYDGLIFTSPRAVDAIGEAMPWLPSENVLWHNKSVYAVGSGTAEALRSIGFEPDGEESGSAETLANIISKRSFDRPLLFLSGDRRRDVLPTRLRSAGIQIEELCVYENRSRSPVGWPTEQVPDWVVFFSPSGFEAIREEWEERLRGVRIAAIGPTTAEVLGSAGVVVATVAGEPSPRALVEALREYDASDT